MVKLCRTVLMVWSSKWIRFARLNEVCYMKCVIFGVRVAVKFNTTIKSSIKISEDAGHYELLINRGYQVTRETET